MNAEPLESEEAKKKRWREVGGKKKSSSKCLV